MLSNVRDGKKSINRGRSHSKGGKEELEDDEETNEVVRISMISKRIYSTKNRFLELSEMNN